MSMTPDPTPQARIGAGVLGLAFIAVATGALPVAGLAFQPLATPAAEPAVVTEPVEPEPVVEPAEVPVTPPEPQGPTLLASDAAAQGPLRLEATLGQRAVLRADGRVDVVVGVTVADAPASPRGPVDVALVVDTSASMSGVIGLVKKATLGAIERLGPGDRLVLVTYADEAQVAFTGHVDAAARAELVRIVGRLVAARGTNIADGVATARAALAALPLRGDDGGSTAARFQRLVLLSDGAPTVGETAPGALTAAAARVRGAGATFSCVGLGAAYQEALLASMADSGGGAFHHVDGPDALPRVYAAELEAQRAVVLRGARLRLVPAAGVEVEQVTAWSHEADPSGAVVALGDLSAGRSLKVVVRLRMTHQTDDPAARDVVAVRLEGEQQASALEVGPLRAAVTDDPAAADESRVAEVETDLQQAALSERLGEARAAAARGEGDLARTLVREARALAGRDQVTFQAPSGEEHTVSLDALADDLAEGARSDRGRRAMKVTIAAARAVGR